MSLLAAAACSGPSDSAVPRKEAYPRVRLYEADYAYPSGLPLRFAVNSAAEYEVERKESGDVWLSLRYPAYDAWIYCTFTNLKNRDAEAAVANRLERMSLNIGGATAVMETFKGAGGADATMLTAKSAPMAPVQFIALDSLWLVSGSAVFGSASTDASPDSLAPMIDVLRRDIAYSLNGI